MQFAFVYAGWEGTANDSCIMADGVYNPMWSFPRALPGEFHIKIYLYSYSYFIFYGLTV